MIAIHHLIYRSHRWLSSVVAWMTRRFTPAGRFAVAALVVFAGFGVDTNATMAYQGFTLILGLLVVSWVLGRLALPRRAPGRSGESAFTVERILPQFISVGAPANYTLVLRNHTRKRRGRLALFEELADPRPSWPEFREAAGGAGDRLDRWLGHVRWNRLVAQNRVALVKEQAVASLAPGEAVEVPMEVAPLRRGRLRFCGTTVSQPDLLGLCRQLVPSANPQSLLVLPKRYPLPPVEMPGNQRYQQGGVALASSIGESEEFISLRDYRPGDPLRRIHWPSWAKTDRPIVKEYQDEFFVRHALVLDTFTDGREEEVFEEAVSVAASFACTVETQESLLDLLFVGPEAYCFTIGRGVGHVERILEVLAAVEACRDQPFESLQDHVLQHAASVSGCICVLLAWDDARRRLVEQLQALGIPVRALVIIPRDAPDLEPGAMTGQPEEFTQLRVGQIEQGLAKLK